MKLVIYVIYFRDGSSYIGSTSDFSTRRRKHLRAAIREKYTTNSKLTHKLREDGICCIYEVASVFDKSYLHIVEAQVIETFNPTLNVYRKPSKVNFHQDANFTGKQTGEYPSISKCARQLKIGRQTLRKYGSPDAYYKKVAEQKNSRIVKMGPPDPRKQSTLIYSGSGWFYRAQVRSVGRDTYEKRRSRGWSEWDALTTPPKKTLNIAALCVKHGISYAVYWKRKKGGANCMQALGIIKQTKDEKKVKKRTLTAGGKTRTVDAWAKELGVTPQVIHQRIYNGWEPEEVVGLKLRPSARARKEKPPKQPARELPTYTYGGVTGTLSALCRHFGETDSLIRTRLARGWTIEEAFEMPLHWVKPRKRQTNNESLKH